MTRVIALALLLLTGCVSLSTRDVCPINHPCYQDRTVMVHKEWRW